MSQSVLQSISLHWQGVTHRVLSGSCRYHSHPHITVLPSHVDVRTQAMYQKLDEGFVGIIVSAFNQVHHRVFLQVCTYCKAKTMSLGAISKVSRPAAHGAA